MEALDYWRLCDELTIFQAAMLIAGEDPSTQTWYQNNDNDHAPMGFVAAREAIINAVRRGMIKSATPIPFDSLVAHAAAQRALKIPARARPKASNAPRVTPTRAGIAKRCGR